LYADSPASLPSLPTDFWTAFPNNSSDTTVWRPIGNSRVVPSVSPQEPVVVEWDWTTPTAAADPTCLLVVMDCAADPLPAGNKILDVDNLIRNEKRVGLLQVHVV
jgi:hypothetical protein